MQKKLTAQNLISVQNGGAVENLGGMLKKNNNNQDGELPNSVFHIENLSGGYASGVMEVVSFSPENILVKIASGEFEILGEKLEIKSFNVDSGELKFVGEITSITSKRKKQTFLERIFK